MRAVSPRLRPSYEKPIKYFPDPHHERTESHETRRFFPYGDKETEYLEKAGQTAGKGHRKGRENRKNRHSRLVRRARTFHRRTTDIHQSARDDLGKNEARLREITPQAIDRMPEEELQRFGISFRKAAYIKSAAKKIVSGEFDIQALETLPDEEVCAKLTELEGVGVWTAEMLMIFSMQRPDVFSFQDLAIIRGLRMTYRHRSIDRTKFDRYRKRYSPYASVASLYLWAVASGAVDGIKDCKPLKNKVRRKNKPPKPSDTPEGTYLKSEYNDLKTKT